VLLWDLRVLIVGLILSVRALHVATLSPLILEWLLLQVAWHPFFFHKLSSSLHLFVILLCHPFHSSLYYYACILFWFSLIFLHLMFFPFSQFTFIIIITILCFSLCPLEVNLHTYLTTWLSLYPVGIFFGLSPYLLISKSLYKRVTHKICNLKINSHQVIRVSWLF